MSGIYIYDGRKLYGDGREVDPSPSMSEEFREECLRRTIEIAESMRKVIKEAAKGAK